LTVFPIHDVSSSIADRPEALGSKEKFWLIPNPDLGLPAEPHLFKVGRPNTGENWAEKACCEFLKLLSIPCAEYHLAVHRGTSGVISQRFLPGAASFIPANMILSKVDPAYDGSLKFRQVRYTLLSALELLRRLELKPHPGLTQAYQHLRPYEMLIAYILFDVFVGNTDRHHENWGLVVARSDGGFDYWLAPSFDHASSLGRDQSDERRQERLETRDMRFSVEAYAERARSAFHGHRLLGRPLTGREIVEMLAQSFPEATKFWSERLVGLAQNELAQVFEQIPGTITSDHAVRFAMRMLSYNTQMIREVALGR
jgi:HipA-like C-terminal domain